jgi:hypothetical protein
VNLIIYSTFDPQDVDIAFVLKKGRIERSMLTVLPSIFEKVEVRATMFLYIESVNFCLFPPFHFTHSDQRSDIRSLSSIRPICK